MLNIILAIAIVCAVVAAESRDLRYSVYALGGVGACLALAFLVFQSYFFAVFQLAVVALIVYLFIRILNNRGIVNDEAPHGAPLSYVVAAVFALLALWLFLPALRLLPTPQEISTKYAETLRAYDVFGMIVIVAVAGIALLSMLRNKGQE
ncbi:MAG: hypothetical protein WCW67_04920 [Candidatus Margulisiibacteriota bacterium]|jgi:NADH:ubiquinone oxidoreductase subunit 6 (subunit J)